MNIFINEQTKMFHLQNDRISYVMCVLPSGGLGQLYFGKRIHHRENFGYLLESSMRSHSAYFQEEEVMYSYEHIKQEYPTYGAGDFRQGAVEILQENGSRLSSFHFQTCKVVPGKPKLEGLPATYVEEETEAKTLQITLQDPLTKVILVLSYTMFHGRSVIARSVQIINEGEQPVSLERVMSLSLDLPDSRYEWIQFSGSWGRERSPICRKLDVGTTQIESLRGHSSHQENPFVILKRPETDEKQGEALGISFVYSGNFQISAQVDPYQVTRVMAGIHPAWFSWRLEPGAAFQAPEALLTYSDEGLGALSRTLHDLFRERLARGYWRDQPRPILLNNWEATYFDFNEEKLLTIADQAARCGVELFVLDDGWFGARRSDHAGLGDWTPAKELLPEGLGALARKVEAMGLKFGLWIEPEMVNPDSDLYRAHPDWCLHIPGRHRTLSRNQLVLDFARGEVVDYIYQMIHKVLESASISYVKWDMNRSITECYSEAYPPAQQGEIFHRYILGVYDLYERLIRDFPHILFESCAGGGGRFDAGMLYYAPQAWTSDDTDAQERVKIQYGTSFGYPLVSMGSHVSAVPNHQTGRVSPLRTRALVAAFGTFGYELDLNTLTHEEQDEVKEYSAFMKQYRGLIQFGDFYRLSSPFTEDEAAWMVVSQDRREALVGYYRMQNRVNDRFIRLPLQGLDPDLCYLVEGMGSFYGDELMNAGMVISDASSCRLGSAPEITGDYYASVFALKAAAPEEKEA